jgi:hypothetical protein
MTGYHSKIVVTVQNHEWTDMVYMGILQNKGDIDTGMRNTFCWYQKVCSYPVAVSLYLQYPIIMGGGGFVNGRYSTRTYPEVDQFVDQGENFGRVGIFGVYEDIWCDLVADREASELTGIQITACAISNNTATQDAYTLRLCVGYPS